jgi:predicted GNAT family N-acyltransferase
MQFHFIQTGTPEYEAMIRLRMKVLLDPVGIPQSYIQPEKEKQDILIGAFENQQLVGCCILTSVDNRTVQLRQMAVDDAVQKKGVGRAILAFAEKTAKKKGYTTLIMHARDAVLEFYRKCGYEIDGEAFFEVGISHHKMKKQIDQL